jgi:hypothetical protein
MGLVKNEKFLMLPGKSIVWDVGCLLQVCEDSEMMTQLVSQLEEVAKE